MSCVNSIPVSGFQEEWHPDFYFLIYNPSWGLLWGFVYDVLLWNAFGFTWQSFLLIGCYDRTSIAVTLIPILVFSGFRHINTRNQSMADAPMVRDCVKIFHHKHRSMSFSVIE